MVYGSCMLETSLADVEYSRQHVTDSLKCRAGILKLQAQLERDPIFMGPLILSCIRDSFWDIVLDQYGNYLIQKLLPVLTSSQLQRILKTLTHCFLDVCMSLYGSSVIHNLIDVMKGSELEEWLVTLTSSNINLLATNQYGVHILIHMADVFDLDFSSVIAERIKYDVLFLTQDRFGCGLIKYVLTRNDTVKDIILANLAELSMDQYGNFIVQHVMTSGDSSVIWTCIAELRGHLTRLAMNKSGSNVLETLIASSNNSQRVFLTETFMGDSDTFLMLCEHEYGNYVVQRLLQCGTCYQQTRMRRTFLDCFSKSNLPHHSRHLYQLVSE